MKWVGGRVARLGGKSDPIWQPCRERCQMGVCVDRLLCNNRSLAVLLCYVIFFFDTLEQPTYVTFVFLKLKVLVQI